jgi:hypothetical protein
MERPTFFKLRRELRAYGLEGSKNVSIEEKILMFLFILSGQSNAVTQERFQHSGETVSRIFKEVTYAIIKMESDYIKLPLAQTPHNILEDRIYYPYFQNCLGALDGTHLRTIVPAGIQGRFRNRKGFLSQNVLGVCNFDMDFVYVLAGWEGSAHDGLVLSSALDHGFQIPKGFFYLGDAGYALLPYCLTPYRGVRYHLKEWQKGNQAPQNAEELFNLRHSRLRNVIERVFGVIKARFPILTSMPSYPYVFQVSYL